ncbi:MAG: AsmA-like C-terminal region-containing protein [Myxococcota bacterium]
MSKRIKVIVGVVAVLVGLTLVALAVLPVVLKGRVADFMRAQLNEQLEAEVDFDAIDLSLLSTFPTLTAEVVGLEVIGVGEFEGTPLLSVAALGAGLDLRALIFDEAFVIESIDIRQPVVNVVERSSGNANYDIVRSSGDPANQPNQADSTNALTLQIRRYRIRDATITYRSPDAEVSIESLNHEGSATIAPQSQTLRSSTTIAALTTKAGRITYVRGAKVALEVGATLLPDDSRVDMFELEIRVNTLTIAGSGSLAWPGDGVDLDVKLASGQGQSITALLSAIPGAYAKDLAGVTASGTFSIEAQAKGTLDPTSDDLPAFGASLFVRNGSLQYPDLPVPLSDINVSANVKHPGGPLDEMRIDVPEYAISAGQSHASGAAEITKPISRPNVRLDLKGRFHAEEIANAYPLPDVERLEGVVTVDVDLVASAETIQRLEGDIALDELVYDEKDAPTVRVPKGHIVFSPRSTRIDVLRAELGQSDVSITGSLSPISVFLRDDQLLVGNLRVVSREIHIDDFLSEEGSAASSSGGETTPFLLPDGIDASLRIRVGDITYDDLVLSDFVGSARLRKRKLTLKDVKAKALGGAMKVSGFVATPENKPAVFDLQYTVDKASFAEAFESLPSMRAYAPMARFVDGRFSANIHASGQLGKDGSPKLRSIDADGLVVTLQSRLGSNFKPLSALSRAVPAIPEPLDVSSLRTKFRIEDGAVKVKPFEAKAQGLTMTVSGSHGLDQEMDYRIGTAVPVAKVTGGLAKQVRGLGIDVSKLQDVGVGARITGSISNPRVSVDVDSDALRGAVAATVSAELEKKRQQALSLVAAQNRKAMVEAKKRAAQIRKEGQKAAARLRQEGNKRADQLVEEAGSNTFKQIAAKEAAKQVRRESDKRADQLAREADKRADQVVAEAEKRAAKLEQQVEAQSRKAQEEATGRIAP